MQYLLFRMIVLPHLLQQEDSEISDTLADHLKKEGINILISTSAEHISKTEDVYRIRCSRENDSELELEADALLVAVGRSPNVVGRGLE